MTDDSGALPITESQIIPADDAPPPAPGRAELGLGWRARLGPYRKHLHAAAVLAGMVLGATLYFATHQSLGQNPAPVQAMNEALARLHQPPPSPAVAAAPHRKGESSTEKTVERTSNTERTVKSGNTVRTVKRTQTVKTTRRATRTRSATARR